MDIAGINIPIEAPQITLGGFGSTVSIIFSIVIFLITGTVIVFLVRMNRIYNKKIEIYENLSGHGYYRTGVDRARIVKIGTSGEEIFLLRKRKVFRTAYGRKMGPNTYWFAVGPDGYWYNVVLGDLDTKMGVLDIEPIDRDMRVLHVGIAKNIVDRYQKKKIEKMVAWTITGVTITALIIMVGSWFVTKQMAEAAKLTARNIDAVKPIAEALMNAVSHLDTICGGSGYSPVG